MQVSPCRKIMDNREQGTQATNEAMRTSEERGDKYELSTMVTKLQAAIKMKWKTLDPEPWDKMREILEVCDFDLAYAEAVIRSMPESKKTNMSYYEWVLLYIKKGWVKQTEVKKTRPSRGGIDPETGNKVIYGTDEKGDYMVTPKINDPFATVKKFPKFEDRIVCQESMAEAYDQMLDDGSISQAMYDQVMKNLEHILPTKAEAVASRALYDQKQESKRRRQAWTPAEYDSSIA